MTLSPESAALLRQALEEAEQAPNELEAYDALVQSIEHLLLMAEAPAQGQPADLFTPEAAVPQAPHGYAFVARWHEQSVDLAEMARTYGADARCCHPGPAGGLPLIIRPVNVHN